MRIALLHLDLGNGPLGKNLLLLEQAASTAAAHGAQWVVTPETALQGYFFYQNDPQASIPVQPQAELVSLQQLALQKKLVLFLGCAEKDEVSGELFNSCLVVGVDGKICGRHRKIHSHGKGAEGWTTRGSELQPVPCGEVTAGVLICADSYFEKNALQLKKEGAQMLVVPAAWPPGHCGGPPEEAWKRCSRESGLPVCVCNQTGQGGNLDLSQAQSAVVTDGEVRMAYAGKPAILLFDWEEASGKVGKDSFQIHYLGGAQ